MSTMSVTELQREIKNSVVTPLMNEGIGGLRLIQVDNFKWLIVTEIEGVLPVTDNVVFLYKIGRNIAQTPLIPPAEDALYILPIL